MPGIAGIINKAQKERNEKDLGLMIDCMMHEKFYTSGTYVNDKLGLYAGWVCHKGSFSDCMPILNEKKDLVLIFTGENFADKTLTNQLKKQGHEFNPYNGSYLIHLYENEGDNFLQRLNGWFSGILVDLRNSKLILFNDRYGMQRIYYQENKNVFIFSSEAKSLLKVCPELREINLQSLGEFFSCECVLQNRTLFSNIFLLPGGSVWTFLNNNIKKECYFNTEAWENQPILEKEAFYKKLKETFLNILPKYFYSRQPIALSLTGGLDSRMILSCIDNQPGGLPCYTFGGMYRKSFDVKVSRKVADACHQPHQVLLLDGMFLSNFPDLAEKTVYISDGYLDVCGSYELYLNRLAREIAPIRITGNYGSEVLRSVRAFKAVFPSNGLFHPDFTKHIRNAAETFAEANAGHRLTFAIFKQAPWQGHGRRAIEQSQLTLRTPYMDNDLVRLVYQAPANACTTPEISLRLLNDCNPVLSKIMTDRGVGGDSNYFLSMWTRLYYEFLFKAEYYYNDGMPHWMARLNYTFDKFASLCLERLFLGRHKFCHIRIWFRDELSDYVREILFDKRTANRPYLNKKFLEKMVNGHIKGNKNYTYEINLIITAELLQRLLIEN